MSIVVDLPAPLGPSSATVSPRPIVDVDAAHGVDRPGRSAPGLLEARKQDRPSPPAATGHAQ